jgi:hypothetical protein
MIDKLKKKIRQILLNNTIHKYKINLTRYDVLKNHKNFGLLEKQLNGGGKNLTIEYNNEHFIFTKLDDDYTTIMSYILQAQNKDTECVIISIDKESNTASIDNLSTDDLQCTKQQITYVGTFLVELTIKLIKKYKDKFNIKKLLLTDHSSLYCNKIKKTISLADLYTLKHGTTFYGKFGFIPYDSNSNTYNIDSNIKLNKKFNKNKKIIKKLLVKDSKLLYYLEKFYMKEKYDIRKIINYVKDNENKLLSEVIAILSSKDNFNIICEILNYIIPKLFIANHLTSFHNKSFELYI